MKQYFVYILLCSDNSYYTGITNDMERRLAEHQTGENVKCYTYRRRPVKLVFCERFADVNQAIAFEKQVKGWRRAKKEAIIKGSWELLPGLAKLPKTSKEDVILNLPKGGAKGLPHDASTSSA